MEEDTQSGSKATIVLLTLAALGFGALIGASLIGEDAGQDDVIAGTDLRLPDTGGAPVYRFIGPESVVLEHDEFGHVKPAAVGENFIAREGPFKTQSISIALAVDAATEYKALMQQGDSIVYRWRSEAGQVYFDFHAHDDAFGDEFFTRYAEGEGGESAGSIVAAYAGEHGWYWLNIEDQATVITLEVAGYYDDIVEVEVEAY